jgi:hypothetical protein
MPDANKPQLSTIVLSSLRFVLGFIVGERKIVLSTGALLIVWVIALLACPSLVTNVGLIIYCALISIAYAGLIVTLARYLCITDAERRFQDVGFILLYGMASLVLILLFAYGWLVFGNFCPAGGCGAPQYQPDRVDSLYLASVVFSTLGLGDFVPSNPAGKLFLSFQVFFSSIHLVAFFSLLLTKRRSDG